MTFNWVFLFMLSTSTICFCLGDDSATLMAFKGSITRDPNGVLHNWSPALPLCNWTGVTCHPKHPGKVKFIVLNNQSLSGTVTALAQLKYLEVIEIEANNLQGTIPAEFGNCTALKRFHLGSNAFTGKIPDIFQNLNMLSSLSLWGNKLEGSIPHSLASCSRLKQLDLAYNSLTGQIPELHNLTHLLQIRLHRNKLFGPIPPSIGNCSKLVILSLSNNLLSGSVPPSIGNCNRLQELNLNLNQLNGSVPPEIGKLDKLTALAIGDNHLTGSIPGTIGNLSYLFILNLGNNRLTGTIPTTVGLLKRIQELSFDFNKLSGSIPSSFSNCEYLGVLGLSNNSLTGDIPQGLGHIQSLSILYIDHNNLTGEIPSSFGGLSRLQSLDLSHNMLKGTLPDSLSNLGETMELLFDVSSNRLEGQIPSWIGKFGKVQNISLSSNSFSGEIPITIGECKGLLFLNLSFNSLSGQIPTSMKSLQSLKSVDLAVNRLDGSIPSSLANLSDLEFFNVSMNNLQGAIPSEGPFSKLSSNSFLGNPLLCGALVNKKCSDSSNKTSKLFMWLVPLVLLTSFFVFVLFFICCKRVLSMQRTDATNAPFEVGTLRMFSHQELLEMTNNFDSAKLLGEGTFSRVFRGTLNGITMAVKVLKEQEEVLEMKNVFLTELGILARLRHRNITKVLGYCWSNGVAALVMEYMPNGSLADYLRTRQNLLSCQSKLKIAFDIAQAVHYIHHEFDKPIIHSDLKPENVLLDADHTARLADFGISKQVFRDDNCVSASNFRGTIGFAAPEYATSTQLSTMGDIYSYGILLLVLITEKSPTDLEFQSIEQNIRDWVLDNIDAQGHAAEIKLLIQVALLCTSTNPKDRPTIKHVLAMLLEIYKPKVEPLPSLYTLANAPNFSLPINRIHDSS